MATGNVTTKKTGNKTAAQIAAEKAAAALAAQQAAQEAEAAQQEAQEGEGNEASGEADPDLAQEVEIKPEDLEFPMPHEGWHTIECLWVKSYQKDPESNKKAQVRLKVQGGEDNGMEISTFESLPYEGESPQSAMRRNRLLHAFGAKSFAQCKGASAKAQFYHDTYQGRKNCKVKAFSPIG